MNKLPWMKYDPDFVSLEVEGMSLEEEGAYSRCVRHIWRNGPLPLERVQQLCRKAFAAVKDRMEERDGLFSFAWLEDARGVAKAWVLQRSEAGKASASKRTTVERPLNDSSTTVLSPSLSSIQEGKDEEFETLWVTYERYGSKGKSLAYWKKLPPEDRAAVIAKAPAYVASTPGCEFRMNLEGWLNPNERRWEKPIVARTATNGTPPVPQPVKLGWNTPDGK